MARTDAPVTTPTTVPEHGRSLAELEAAKKDLLNQYTKEERETISVSPMYAAHFGNVMAVNINTVVVRVRIDGSPQSIPKTFADEVRRRVMEVDKQLRMENRMSNVQGNFERAPGELVLY